MMLTDEELVMACRNGDESAWEAITLKYQALLFSIPQGWSKPRSGLGRASGSFHYAFQKT